MVENMGIGVPIDPQAWRQALIAGAGELGVVVTVEQAQAMRAHADELLTWNRKVNLTAITDVRQVAIKHFVDSLVPVPLIPQGSRVMDAGTGGGFPGLPIKIVRPDLSLTLVDSVRKKVSFLNYTIGKLSLREVHAVHGRLEDLADHCDYRGRFDLVICRAFSSIADFVRLTLPFLCPSGSLLALKGPQVEHDHEIDDVADDGSLALAGIPFRITIHRYALPMLGDQRRLVHLMRL